MDTDEEPTAKRVRIDSYLSDGGSSGSDHDHMIIKAKADKMINSCTCPCSGNVQSAENTSTIDIGVTNTSLPADQTLVTCHTNVTKFRDPMNREKIDNEKTDCSSITQSEIIVGGNKDNATEKSSNCLENLEDSSCETKKESEHCDDSVPVRRESEQHSAQSKNVYDLEIEESSEEVIPPLQGLRQSKSNKEDVVSDKKSQVLPNSALNSEKSSEDANQSGNSSEKGDTSFKLRHLDVAANKKITKNQRRVSYMYSKELIQQCDQMQKIPERASMVHSLIEAYGILKYMGVVAPSIATEESLCQFHSPEYVEFLKKINDQEDEEIYDEEAAQFGLTYDCPVHQGVFDYALAIGGATVSAAEELISDRCDVAINWCGGWHHAQKDSASGFCYVNDIVLGILKLREKFSRVLYVDLDLHHGDGVQDAFYATPTVMTVSIHKYATGFFPGSGQLEDIGIGKGKKYCINIPLQDGARDKEFVALFCRVIQKVHTMFKPEAVVCQCGADGLAGDPMDSFNLTPLSLGRCLYYMLDWGLPTLLLGGGGYHHTNTARCWTFLTAIAVGKKLPTDIPDHQFFMEYGPDYGLNITAGNRKDQNSQDYLRKIHRSIMDILSL